MTWMINYIPQYYVRCNNLVMPQRIKQMYDKYTA